MRSSVFAALYAGMTTITRSRVDPRSAASAIVAVSVQDTHGPLHMALQQTPWVEHTNPAAHSGLVAHWRHYKVEPVLWVSGLSLAAVTAYFRIAGDKHYLSDVVTGSAVGVVSGLTIPRLMEHDVAVVPTPGGAAVVGSF